MRPARFLAVLLCVGFALPTSTRAQAAGITSAAVVEASYSDGTEIHFKPQEKVAMMFLEAIASMEDDCERHLDRFCQLPELVQGPKAKDWNLGRLKYDPAKDTNYKYELVLDGKKWTARAIPQKPGLGGFLYVGSSFMPKAYFNPKGAATPNPAQEMPDRSISGEIFKIS